MDLVHYAVDVFLHLDVYLNQWAASMGPWLYLLLFLIVFCETGLVVTPFLPGDSLLFTVGALAATEGSPLDVWLVMGLLFAAAVLGDAANFAIGKAVGPRAFHSETSRWLNRKHLLRTHAFFVRHGGKTIVLARFIPIIRTFAPFVAGIGTMPYSRFFVFNVAGAAAWVGLMTGAGNVFGNIPAVRERFQLVIIVIVVLSILPGVVEYVRAWRYRRRRAAET